MKKFKSSEIINFLIYLSLYFTPLIIIPRIQPFIVDYFYFPKILFIYIVVGVMAIIWLIKRETNKIDLDFEEKIIMFYVLVLLITTVFSINIFRSIFGNPYRLEGVGTIISYIFLFIITKRKFRFSKTLLNLFLLSTSIVALYGILQFFGYDPIPRDIIRLEWKGRAFSTMGNPNFLGAFLTLVFPIGTFAYIYTKKNIFLLTAGIVFLSLLCTMTRGSWIGAFISLIVLICYVFRYKYSLKHLSIVLLIFVVITIFINSYSDGGVFDRLNTITNDISKLVNQSSDYEQAGANRIFIWTRVIELIKLRPLLGYGLETLDIVFAENYHDDIMNFYGRLYRVDKAHNEYLHIAFSSGIPSLMLYLLFIISIIYKAFKNIKNNPFIIPLLCCVIGYLVQAFFNISVVSVAYIYWIFLGVMLKFSLESNTNCNVED